MSTTYEKVSKLNMFEMFDEIEIRLMVVPGHFHLNRHLSLYCQL